MTPARKRSSREWRVTPLPAGWDTEIRPAILERDGYRCTWIDGPPHGGWPLSDDGTPLPENTPYLVDDPHRCTTPATDVDHAGPPWDHRPVALRSLCKRHHRTRTGQQGNRARQFNTPSRKRTPPPHPGIIA